MIKIEDKKNIQLYFLILLFKITVSNVFIYINYRFFKLENEVFEQLSQKELFFFAVVFAPIIETLIFQLYLFRLLEKIKIKKTSIIIILMSIAFALAHCYHWLYIIAAFINALFLNYFYVNVLKNKNEFNSVVLTITLHSFYNLYGFLFVE